METGKLSSYLWLASLEFRVGRLHRFRMQPQPTHSTQSTQIPIPEEQTKRILGVIPNFRAVSADVKLPAQSVKEKLLTATEDSFDYSSIFIPAALAGYSMATNATPEFGQGAAGYGRYL